MSVWRLTLVFYKQHRGLRKRQGVTAQSESFVGTASGRRSESQTVEVEDRGALGSPEKGGKG